MTDPFMRIVLGIAGLWWLWCAIAVLGVIACAVLSWRRVGTDKGARVEIDATGRQAAIVIGWISAGAGMLTLFAVLVKAAVLIATGLAEGLSGFSGPGY